MALHAGRCTRSPPLLTPQDSATDLVQQKREGIVTIPPDVQVRLALQAGSEMTGMLHQIADYILNISDAHAVDIDYAV